MVLIERINFYTLASYFLINIISFKLSQVKVKFKFNYKFISFNYKYIVLTNLIRKHEKSKRIYLKLRKVLQKP